MRRRAWLSYLLVGVALTLAYLFVRSIRVGPLFNLIGFSSPAVILVAVRLHKPEQKLPWYLFALGQTLFIGGDIISYNYERFFGTELPFPALSDPFYLSVYPCLIAGILLLIRHRNPGRDRTGLIDSLIIAVGLGVLSWVFLIAPYAHDATLTLLQRLVAMAYPLMDLILLTVVARLAVGAGKRETSFKLLITAVVCLLITDAIYGWILLNVPGGYTPGGLLDGGWALFYLLWGAASLHPSMRSLSEPAPDQEPRLTGPRLALLAGASLMAPVVEIIQITRGEDLDQGVVMAAAIVLFLLVIARMAGLVHRQEQSTAREKALREAGAELVTATSRESIYTAALEGTKALAGQDAAIRVLIAQDSPQEFAVVATAGGRFEKTEGSSIALSSLADWKRKRLAERVSYHVDIAESTLAEPLCLPPEAGFVYVSPLFMKDELRGLLVVAGITGLSRAIRDGLDALTSQVALALESAALTEDLLRRQSEARFSSLVQNSSDVVTVIDADTTVRYISPSVERVLGYEPVFVEGKRLAALIHPDDEGRVLAFFAAAVQEADGHTGLIEFRVRHHDEHWLHVETLRTNLLHDPNVKGIVLNTRDISERKTFEEQLSHQAFHDSVTNLANRALFRDRMEHALERRRRDDKPLAVLLMDLDDFKTINDSLGHAAGDRLLAEVGDRLKNCLRAADTAARLGGDEFAVLLEDPGQGVEAADVAARVLEVLEAPFDLDGKEVFVRASIGIATGDPDRHGPDGAEEILRNADVAMYMAKEGGKGRYQVFEPAMHDVALQRLELKAGLQRALENHEFVLHYQPVIELETGNITGVEALIRWNHPTRGMMAPLEFIPLAEETGLIVSIGRWVLEEACRQARGLHEHYPMDPPLHMAVNISARQLQRPELVAEVAKVLMDTGLEPSALILEITESVMMRDMDLSIQRLGELKELGVQLAVDDFGTGYSSLNYIQRFPVDILKVDKSFVDAMNTDARKSALTATILKLAEDLELKPVAEGIERADQLDRLLELQCDLGQGFYFAKPLPTDGLRDLLTARAMLADRDRELSG
ncbi:MAG: EAL domain-containing protein [Actinobacteria bacterium]|nr:EAL domain-containing protein [Actinomycetota bacterium]